MCNFSPAALCHFRENNRLELLSEIAQPPGDTKVQAAAASPALPRTCPALPRSSSPSSTAPGLQRFHWELALGTEQGGWGGLCSCISLLFSKGTGKTFCASFNGQTSALSPPTLVPRRQDCLAPKTHVLCVWSDVV